MLVYGHPSLRSILAGLPLCTGGLLLRVWARGHLIRQTPLAVSGPYAIVRHPLYVGSFVVGLGFLSMLNGPLLLPVYVAGYLAMYVPKAMREEQFLRSLHGEAYARYVQRVGAVWPRLASPGDPRPFPPGSTFSWRRVLGHNEWRAWLGALATLALMVFRATH